MKNRVTPLLLAATLAVSSMAFVGTLTPVHAITSVDELSDVNREHWAFEALRDLVEKYDVIEGYPDHTFRGNRAPTRWEMAAALDALIKSVGRDLARLGAEKANKTDLQALARLQEEFRAELDALSARTTALEGRAAAIEAKNDEQDNRLTLLEKTQIHGDMSFGVLSDIGANGTHGLNEMPENTNDGLIDGMSAVGRVRLTLDVPVKEDNENSAWGQGDVHVRLVAAGGRIAPLSEHNDNLGGNNPYTGYSRIASDASAFNEGIGTSNITPGMGTGGQTRLNLYVENMHYKQHIKSGLPLLTEWLPGMLPEGDDWATTGDLYMGVIPWRYLFDKSPYRGDEVNQFQNTAFVNTPGVAVNYNMPMVAYQWHQGLGPDMNLDITTGVGSIDNSDLYDGLNVTYEARLNYLTKFLGEGMAKPGSLYGGGYHIWNAGARTLGNVATTTLGTLRDREGNAISNVGLQGSTNAFYVGWNQEWYQGIGTTVNYMLSNAGNPGLIYSNADQTLGGFSSTTAAGGNIALLPRQSISGVLSIPMSAMAPGWRDKDVLGIGYALVDLYEDSIESRRFEDAMEQVVETYYKWQVNDQVSVIPSVQFYFNRGGLDQNDFSTVIGLRTNFVF